MEKRSIIRVLWLTVLLALCTACATGDANVQAVSAGDNTVKAADASPGTADYHLLVAEMALQKKQYDIAVENYRAAAEASRDAETAQRCTEVAAELGRNADALACATRWRKLDSKNAGVYSYLARLSIRERDAKQAASSMRTLIKLSKEEPKDVFLPLAGAMSSEANTDIALEALQLLTARYKSLPQAHYAVGIQAMRNGDFELARASAKKATDLDSEWGAAHLLYARSLIADGESDEGIDYAGEHIGGTNSIGERLEYGMLLAAVSRDIEAMMVLEQVMSDDPSNVAAMRALGIIELKAGDFDMAERRFSELLSSGQGTYDAFYYLASIAESRQQNERAYRLYSEVQAGDNAVISQLRAANILLQMDQLDDALQHLERFANQHPQFTIDMALGQGELLAEGDRADEAMMLYDNILKKDPDLTRAQYARAFLLEQLDRVEEAIHQMRIILSANPASATALNALGYTLADRTTQYKEAHELITLAYEKEPDSGPIADSMGWVEYKLGNLPRARELLEKAYEILPDAEVAAHLLEVVHAQGDQERIDSMLKEFAEKFPDAKQIEDARQQMGL